MRRTIPVLVALVAAALVPAVALPSPAGAALDPIFGTGGVATYAPTGNTVDVANAALFQDERVVVAGASDDRMAVAGLPVGEGREDRVAIDFGVPSAGYALLRAGVSGVWVAGTAGGDFAYAHLSGQLNLAPDLTTARVRIPFGADAVARAITDDRGALLLAGSVKAGLGGSVAVARVVSDKLDPTYGNGGEIIDDVTPGDDAVYALTPGGGLAAGRAGGAALVAGYLGGLPNPAFGSGGHLLLDLSPLDDVAYAIVPDGNPFSNGYLVAGSAGTDAFVARVLGNGTLDTTFGTNGVLRTKLGGLSARFTGIVPDAGAGSSFVLSGVVTGPLGTDAALAKLDLSTGSLDPTFGTAGVATSDLGGPSDTATSVVATADATTPFSVAGGDGNDMVVARFSPSGSPVDRHHFGFGTPGNVSAAGSLRLADGRTVLAGARQPGGPFLARLNADGTPDRTFGPAGMRDLGIGSTAGVSAMTVDSSGRILAVVTIETSSSAGQIVAARFGPDGDPDPTFGTGGYANPKKNYVFPVESIQALPDGKVLLGGDYALARLTSSGAVDTSFGGYGAINASSVALPDPDGSLLTFLYDPSGCGSLRAERVFPDGHTNAAWCGGANLVPTQALRLADGRIAVVGRNATLLPYRTLTDTMVAVFLPNGAPDRSFGGGTGVARLDLGRNEESQRLAAGPGGTLAVAARVLTMSGSSTIVVARLLPDGRVDRTFGTGGAGVLASGCCAQGLDVQADGKVVATMNTPLDTPSVIALVRWAPAGPSPVPVRSWGWNALGMLGNGTTADSRAAVAPAGLSNVRQVAAGTYHSVAVLDNGTVWTWGWNGAGALGTVDGHDSTVPVQAQVGGIVAVAAGAYHTLALASDGHVWAWGWNAFGQLGDGTTTTRFHPVPVPIDHVVAIAAGTAHSVALRDDGSVWTWGWNATGQLGDGTTIDRLTPTPVYGPDGFSAIVAGSLHTLAVANRNGGEVMSWGWNGFGQLGVGAPGDSLVPQTVPGLDNVTSVAAGAYHSLALNSDGTVTAWGFNALGQVGDGTTTNRFTPVVVGGLTGVDRVAAGMYHSLALGTDGTVKAWGWNGVGQLGDGTTTDRHTPVRVNQIGGATTIAGGAGHTLVG